MAIDRSVNQNFHFGVGFLKSLLQGIDAGKLADQPLPGMNHPLWIVGHLAVTMEFAGQLADVSYKAPEGWGELFGMGSQPVSDASKYPSLDELIAELDKSVEVFGSKLASIDAAALAAEMPNEEFRKMMPTVGDGLVFILNGHVMMHIGQLSAWRRAIGLPPMF